MATITNTCLPHYTITNTWHISYSLRLTLSPRSIWWSVETIERLSSEHSSLSHSPSSDMMQVYIKIIIISTINDITYNCSRHLPFGSCCYCTVWIILLNTRRGHEWEYGDDLISLVIVSCIRASQPMQSEMAGLWPGYDRIIAGFSETVTHLALWRPNCELFLTTFSKFAANRRRREGQYPIDPSSTRRCVPRLTDVVRLQYISVAPRILNAPCAPRRATSVGRPPACDVRRKLTTADDGDIDTTTSVR